LLVAYLLVQAEPVPVEVQIPASQAFEKYQSGAFLPDGRSQTEWDEIHIPNSTPISLDELPARLAELPTDNEIVAVPGRQAQPGRVEDPGGADWRMYTWMVIQEWKAAGIRPKELAEKKGENI
jgi:hypothetical protein